MYSPEQEIELLRDEIRVLHEAAELTADLVIQQFERTELEKQRYQEAAASLEGFKRTLDQTSDCVFMFDPRTLQFTYVNHGGQNHTGYSAEELSAMTFADLSLRLGSDELLQLLTPLITEPHHTTILEDTHKRKNGVEVPVEIFVQYVAPAGLQGRFFSIVRNISKRLMEEKEKEKMQAKMLHTQKLESVGELAAGISHEINTPIQYIGTNIAFMEEAFEEISELLSKYRELLETVKQGGNTDQLVSTIEQNCEEMDLDYLIDDFPEAAKQANDGVERVRSLVLAMKEFSNPGSKVKEQANINKIIQTTVQISRNEWKYCADVELKLAENLPLIYCLASDIGQVILNMLVNATHSIKDRLEKSPDSLRGQIVITTASGTKRVHITIEDNGCGIDDAILNRIFDPFFTTKEVGKGTGQGLAIARDVIQNKHGGEIEVSSEKGVGTRFTIHLPMR